MKNKWKSLFLILATINVLIIAIIFYYITSPVDEKPIEDRNVTSDSVPFKIQTNKADLNKVINQYLEKQGNGSVDYQISLDNVVNLYSTLIIFNQKVDMKIAFDPIPLENGDLILKEKEISIGKLHLPPAVVLTLLANAYQFPNWMTIQPKEEQVYVDVQELPLKGGLQVEVNEFDLKQDQIMFTLYMPIK
ncbi:YpmS family protein [Neobacillus sp. LXY-4]|uniref:YpmS family protein n=1 Tax=Neobacillus sp. LXY-4 TaxID=3379826 RepID=UPI003EE19B4F